MEYTEQQKQIYNEVCDKYKHNWLNTTVSQTMAMEMISKALTIPVVLKSLNVEKTNANFDEWLQTHEKFQDNTYVWGMGYVMSYSDMKDKHKELLKLNI